MSDKTAQSSASDDNKTLRANKTVSAKPEIAETILGADTVDAGNPTVNLKPAETVVSKARTPNTETLDDVQSDAATDHSAETLDETFISAPDHGGEQTILENAPVPPAERQDLEDHYETLIEDPMKPGGGPDSPGGFVIGDYQILGELGRGGMGVVYKARHRKLNRVVALKMILAGNHAGNDALERFITEARAVAHLQHPGIVQIFDIGEHEKLPYFSLEFVEGSDLQKKLDRQPQSAEYSAAIVQKLAVAMQYAHNNSILHRDLKPPNVLLDANGEPKITDFGLAKQVDGEEASTGTTMGTIMGSPSYMPPEQARGEVSSLTPKSDLYSLGAILYEMLTGRPPFLAQKPLETVMQVVNNEPVSPRDLQPSIPVDIETICLKAMQKDQGARYNSCADLADDLGRFLEGKPILARPVSQAERALKWCRRNPKIAVPSGLAVSAIVLTALIASWAWRTTAAQSVIIAQERDNAQEQRDEAKTQRDNAEKQKLLAEEAKKAAEDQRAIALDAQQQAEENEKVAGKQALVALKSIQYVVTEVDKDLKNQPQLTDVRIKLMDALSQKWDELDLELTGGIEGEAIPTLMTVRFSMARAFAELDQIEKADREYEKLAELARERIELKENSDSSRFNLAMILTQWAPVKKRVDQDRDAITKLLSETVDLVDSVFDDPRPQEGSPPESTFRSVRAQASQNLGVEYLYKGNLEDAAAAFLQSLQDNGKNLEVIRANPKFQEMDQVQKDTAIGLKALEYDRAAVALAYIQLRQGQDAEALQLYDKAIESRKEVFLRNASEVDYQEAYAGFLSSKGRALLWLDRPEEALVVLNEAIELEVELYERDPDVARRARQAATTYLRLAIAHDQIPGEDSQTQKVALLQKCHDIRTKLVANSDDVKNQIELMLVDSRLGNTPNAVKLADTIGMLEGATIENDFDRARAFAQVSRHTDAEEVKAKWIDKALSALERSVEKGYSEPFRIEHDNDLKPLRNELRFKSILASLKANQ